MNRHITVIALTMILLTACLPAMSGRAGIGKLTPLLRHLMRDEVSNASRTMQPGHHEVCAFVRIAADGDEVLRQNGCRQLARLGDIYIASIPLNRLGRLADDSRVVRIEANKGTQTLTDSMAYHIHALPVYDGTGLPQAP